MIQDEFGQQNAVVVLVPNIDLMGVMLMAQFINGLVLPVLLVFMALISSDKRVMGKFKSGRVTKVLIWITVASSPCLPRFCWLCRCLGSGSAIGFFVADALDHILQGDGRHILLHFAFDRGTCSGDVLQQRARTLLRFLALRSQAVVLQRVEDVEHA